MEVIAVTALAAVPITHGVAGHRLHKNATNTWRFKNIFFSGGYRFMTFQGFSWSFFVLALVLALGRMFLHVDQMSVVRTHVNERSLLGGSICSALISEVLMVSSLLTYHRGHHARPGQGHRRTPSAMLQVLQTSGTAIITSLCFILALVGFGLLMTAHRSQAKSPIAQLMFVALALSCFAIAVPVTHGVGGRLRFALTETWSFYNPGRGGLHFMLLQGFGWACFAFSVAGCAVTAGMMIRSGSAAIFGRIGEPIGDDDLKVIAVASGVAGGAGFAAQIILACSLLHFQPQSSASASAAESISALNDSSIERPSSTQSSWQGFFEMLLVLHVIHAPHLLLIAIIATVLIAAPSLAWSATTFAILGVAYSPTFIGAPGSTGLRTWTAFQLWATRVVEDAARRWHGECRVVRDGSWRKSNREERRYIFGYHPHGMYPAAACWFHLTPQFASLFPSIPTPVTLGASVIFRVPILRDVAMWAGARNVSRNVFLKSLREQGAVVLCPGGQAELVEHVGGDGDDVVTLCTRHRGFIRIAIEENAHLVPVFVFGESQATRNIIKWKAAQRWTYKRLGFPMPFLPGGFKGFLPIPAPLPLSFVVGEPIKVPEPGPGGTALEEDVLRTCDEYYQRIQDLFERYKVSSGFPHLRLVFKDD